jgi:hypothetical protein
VILKALVGETLELTAVERRLRACDQIPRVFERRLRRRNPHVKGGSERAVEAPSIF